MLIVVFVLTLFTLFGTLELLALTLGAILSRARKNKLQSLSIPTNKKIVYVIPAHNEECGIADTLKSLKKCTDPLDIYVIVDNCTDNTASIAKENEVFVIERIDPNNRGKDFALKYAFEILLKKGYDVFVIIDADTIVSENLNEVVQSEFSRGIDALQVYDGVLNYQDNWSLRLLRISYLMVNLLRPLGRNYWGFSAGIFGNGFALSKKTLLEVPFNVNSLVEDLNYHQDLVKAGKKVTFSDTASVLAEMPTTHKGRAKQRTKWEKGRLRSIFTILPNLVQHLIKERNYRLIEPILDLLTLPLSYHVFLLLVILAIPVPITQIIALAGLLVVGFHVLYSLKIGRSSVQDYLALVAAPFYIVWKLVLLKSIVRKAASEKDRAERRNEN